MRRKKERSNKGQINKQGKATQHTQGSHFSSTCTCTMFDEALLLPPMSFLLPEGIRPTIKFCHNSNSTPLLFVIVFYLYIKDHVYSTQSRREKEKGEKEETSINKYPTRNKTKQKQINKRKIKKNIYKQPPRLSTTLKITASTA